MKLNPHPTLPEGLRRAQALLWLCMALVSPLHGDAERIPDELLRLHQQESGALRAKLEVLGKQAIYLEGDRIRYQVTSDQSCYIALLAFQDGGEWVLLYPNRFEPENLVTAGDALLIPDPSVSDYDFIVGEPYGEDTICLVACTSASELAQLLQQLQQSVDQYVAMDRGIFPVSHRATELASANVHWAVDWITVRTAQSLPATPPLWTHPARGWILIGCGILLIAAAMGWRPRAACPTPPAVGASKSTNPQFFH